MKDTTQPERDGECETTVSEMVSIDEQIGRNVMAALRDPDAVAVLTTLVPGIGGDRVVFGGRDKKLHCLRRDDGSVLWTFPTRRKVDGSPVICGDKVVFGSGDGRLYLLRLSDGSELWRYDIGRPVFSSPAVVDSVVVVGASDGRVYAFGAGAERVR